MICLWSVLIAAAFLGYKYNFWEGGTEKQVSLMRKHLFTKFNRDLFLEGFVVAELLLFVTVWQLPEYLQVPLKVVKQICRLQVIVFTFKY